MIKVLHFLDSVGRGGAEMQALDVCRNAADFGIDITLVTGRSGALEEDFRNTGVDVIRLNRRFPIDIYLALQLRKIIREKKIQIVHGHQAVEGLHLYLATSCLKNVKTVLTFEGFVPGRKNRLTAKFIAPLMDVNIAVSESLLSYLKKSLKIKNFDNFHCLFNGADTKRLEPAGISLKQELGLPPEALLAGMVGNFVPDPTKDQMTICKALPKVIDQFPGLHFVFAGRIAEGAEGYAADCVNFCIDKKIIDNVHFLGARNDVPDILAELDLFVFSSLQEGFPVAVCEAMLVGVPMIVSDIEPLLEATANGKYAEIFPVGNEEILSEKIIKVLMNKNSGSEMADKARQFAAENFSIEAHLRGLRTLYESLTTGQNRERPGSLKG